MPRAKAASDPVVGRIVGSSRDIHPKTVGGRKPSMKFPVGSLSNVRYTPRRGCDLSMGVLAEQQAFAKFDLNFVLERYLPTKLKHTERFLP